MRTAPGRRMRDLVLARDGELCRRCLGYGEQIHHRRPRQAGGSTDSITNAPPNLVTLCRSCHDWVESHRSNAYETGWLVHRGADPAQQPITDIYGGRVRLAADGTITTGA